jgi:hypothetical protein
MLGAGDVVEFVSEIVVDGQPVGQRVSNEHKEGDEQRLSVFSEACSDSIHDDWGG